MENISTEDVVGSLLSVGFENVEAVLYAMTMSKLTTEQKDKKQFQYSERPFSTVFCKYVDMNGNGFKFKSGVSLDTNISLNGECPIRNVLGNKRLTEHFYSDFDFREVVFNKINVIGFYRLSEYGELFCDKERDIMRRMFQIDKSQESHNEDRSNNIINLQLKK